MMDTKVARRYAQTLGRASHSWHRQPSGTAGSKVCTFWLAGKCTRNPCRFLHSGTTAPIGYVAPLNKSGCNESHNLERQLKAIRKKAAEYDDLNRRQKTFPEYADERSKHSKSTNGVRPCSTPVTATEGRTENAPLKICEYWVTGNCVYGEKCKYLHSWRYGDGFSMLTQLTGHKKAVTGMTLPSNTDKLFSGSEDGTVRVWNCHTGDCVGEIDMGAAIGCLISEGPWVLVGITNAVKAWNIQTHADLTLSVPAGQVYTMSMADEQLFAGVQDGSIVVWTFNSGTCSFDTTTSLKGHTGAVVSLTIGAKRLYSGSMDNTIRVWELANMQCIHTLNKHSGVVMSMICWDQFLLSCSLDQTLKVWAATEAGEVEVTYTHNEEHGILALSGMHDAEDKPVLLCSCNDNSVRLYELPSFVEKGRIFARQEVRTIHIGPGGLFFTGDGSGRVSIWRLYKDSTTLPDKSA